MRLRSNLVLIPDVAVFYQTEPSRVPDAPPLLVAEVLSLDDRLTAVREKLDEYRPGEFRTSGWWTRTASDCIYVTRA